MSFQLPFKRAFAALLLPVSLVPVLLLAPSLVRAPATLWRHTAHALAPAHPKVVHHVASGPRYFLVGPARLEIEIFEGAAGELTPKVGVSPFAEPEWAARAAASSSRAAAPVVLIARGRELTTASGQPLHSVAKPAFVVSPRAAKQPLHRAATKRPFHIRPRHGH